MIPRIRPRAQPSRLDVREKLPNRLAKHRRIERVQAKRFRGLLVGDVHRLTIDAARFIAIKRESDPCIKSTSAMARV